MPASFASARVAAIERQTLDVVLLDVQMPELDGFDVIEAVGAARMPVTIFVTACDTHALRAFDVNALDYVLKPLDDERFTEAIERARGRVAERNAHSQAIALGGVVTGAVIPRRRIVVRDRGRILVLEHADIDWIAAEGDYVRVHMAGRSYLLRHTMSAMEERLDPEAFARIHRSTIVRVAAVHEVRMNGDRRWLVILRDRTKLKMSRNYRHKLSLP